MVKKMDNYSNRMSDRRFEKFDRSILPNNNDRKFAIIITIGLIISLTWMGSSLLFNSQKPITQKYEPGLNMSYDPSTSTYYIDYTNPNNDTNYMETNIQIPGTSIGHISVFTTKSTEFPANISYKPSNTDSTHMVLINIVKPYGNYSYFLSNIPSEDDKMYEGLFKYTSQFDRLLQ